MDLDKINGEKKQHMLDLSASWNTDVRDFDKAMFRMELDDLEYRLAERLASFAKDELLIAVGSFMVELDQVGGDERSGYKSAAAQHIRQELTRNSFYRDYVDEQGEPLELGRRVYLRPEVVYRSMIDYLAWADERRQESDAADQVKREAEAKAFRNQFGAFENPKTGRRLTGRAVTRVLEDAGAAKGEVTATKDSITSRWLARSVILDVIRVSIRRDGYDGDPAIPLEMAGFKILEGESRPTNPGASPSYYRTYLVRAK